MAFQKPSIPKGTRDFTPLEMVRRNYIFDIIRRIFQIYGYQPIETPAMENLTTLMGKYGVEGDKLLFKILNSGNFLDGVKEENYELRMTNDEKDNLDYKELTPLIAEKGLRYDLTVPFARFVVQHQNELAFPFKRYQIQPVWRADRPQKGRYREFFQCDVDVIGSDSLLYEVELIQIIDEIFSQLGMNVLIRINNRKILAGVAEVIGAGSRLTDITIAMDKLDKIGIDKVNEELVQKGISNEGIEQLRPLLLLEGKLKEKVEFLSDLLSSSETGKKGIDEFLSVKNYLKDLGLKNKFDLDVRLARGLNYYTGTIFEVKALDVPIGSVCGGGRYDDLTGIFGLAGVSGVGISFGADRIYDVLNELQLFPENLESTTRVLFLNFGEEEEKYSLQLLSQIRKAGIASEIYPQNAKLKKQLDYANRKNIPFVVFIGKDEMNTGNLTLKNMKTGDQQKMDFEELKIFLLL
jgi:histidyl-tRNA synthetase